MAIQVDRVVVGPIETNCYIVSSQGHVMVVDPGDEAERIIARLGSAAPELIVLTHGHWDHLQAVGELVARYHAPVLAHSAEVEVIEDPELNGSFGHGLHPEISVDRALEDGDAIELGEASFKVLHTPGHSLGSMCLYEESEGVLFSGDTLFADGSVGRTDLFQGDGRALGRSCQTKIAPLPDSCTVYPGHGRATTIGEERRMNLLLRV